MESVDGGGWEEDQIAGLRDTPRKMVPMWQRMAKGQWREFQGLNARVLF